MNQILRFVRVLAVGAWVGAIVYFAAVVTQGAFAVLSSRDEAGLLVGFTLGGLHLMGVIAAAVFVAASVALEKPASICRAGGAGSDPDGGADNHVAKLRAAENGSAAEPDGLRRRDARE